MIRTSLMAVGAAGGGGSEAAPGNVGGGDGEGCNTEAIVSAIRDEFFRRYMETDSRPLTPTPTLVSAPIALNGRANYQENFPTICNPRERITLILDLRANPHSQQVVGNRYTSFRSIRMAIDANVFSSSVVCDKSDILL